MTLMDSSRVSWRIRYCQLGLRQFGKILPIVEVASGLTFILGVWPRGVGLLSIVLLSSFLVAVAVNIARGRQLDCHCFGTQKGERLGWITVVRLLILLTFAVIIVFNRGPELFAPTPASLVPTSLLLSLLLAVGTFLGIYLLGFFPTVWAIFQLKASPNMTAQNTRVSFKGVPFNQRKTEVKHE